MVRLFKQQVVRGLLVFIQSIAWSLARKQLSVTNQWELRRFVTMVKPMALPSLAPQTRSNLDPNVRRTNPPVLESHQAVPLQEVYQNKYIKITCKSLAERRPFFTHPTSSSKPVNSRSSYDHAGAATPIGALELEANDCGGRRCFGRKRRTHADRPILY